jgi:hypothetical protein
LIFSGLLARTDFGGVASGSYNKLRQLPEGLINFSDIAKLRGPALLPAIEEISELGLHEFR